jgi:hypothetical protein
MRDISVSISRLVLPNNKNICHHLPLLANKFHYNREERQQFLALNFIDYFGSSILLDFAHF